VGVSARNGAVTLTGFIDSYAQKLTAERIAKRIRGVRAVANDIDVRLKLERTDPDIAADVVRALELRSTIPAGVQAVVHGGHVTLTGKVAWLYQRLDAEKAVRHVRGIRGVVNYVTVTPRPVERDIHHRIAAALHRNATLDARHIKVAVDGSKATLSGTSGSWAQREAAERAVGSAPGIVQVDNQIVVEPPPLETVIDDIC
jgi:osmotically-inducible protein OsmY